MAVALVQSSKGGYTPTHTVTHTTHVCAGEQGCRAQVRQNKRITRSSKQANRSAGNHSCVRASAPLSPSLSHPTPRVWRPSFTQEGKSDLAKDTRISAAEETAFHFLCQRDACGHAAADQAASRTTAAAAPTPATRRCGDSLACLMHLYTHLRTSSTSHACVAWRRIP